MNTAAKTGNTPSRRLLALLSSALPTRKFKRTPTILQMEAAECGAASLAMIFAFYEPVDPARANPSGLRGIAGWQQSKQHPEGGAAIWIHGNGYRKEPASLNDLVMPCIIHWNLNHFVVLEGINGQRAQINDPAFGRRRVDLNNLTRPSPVSPSS